MRGSLVAPPTARNSEQLVVEVLDHSWTDANVRILQLAMARLVEHHKEDIEGTRFEHFGRRGTEGFPVPSPFHPQFHRHLQHMEYQLHHSQQEMDRARMRADMRLLEQIGRASCRERV